MNILERNLLKTVKKNLVDSTETDQSCSDHEQWLTYARRMKNAIDTQTAILDILISEDTNPVKIIEPEMDDTEITEITKTTKINKQ